MKLTPAQAKEFVRAYDWYFDDKTGAHEAICRCLRILGIAYSDAKQELVILESSIETGVVQP